MTLTLQQQQALARAEAIRRAQEAMTQAQERPDLVMDASGQPVAMQPPRADAPTPPTARPQTGAERLASGVTGAVTGSADVVEDMARSAGSGLLRGAGALVDLTSLPRRGMDLALARGAEFFMGENAPAWTQRPAEYNAANPPPATALLQRGSVTGPVMAYEPQTTAGEYAQTVGEFVPGAALGPGGVGGNVVRYGVIPGVASETAGQATEGTAAEPFARAGAGIAAGLLAGRPTGAVRPAVPRADPEDARMAEVLIRNGVRPTVGQATDSGMLRRLEGSTVPAEVQLADFTRAALRMTGSSASRATPTALDDAARTIVRDMDRAVAGVMFTPSPALAQQADDIVSDYVRATAGGNVVPDVRNIAEEIAELATNPAAPQVNLATLQDWRRRLGRLMQSPDPQTREASYGLRTIIDDATRAQLQSAGRADDVALLDTAREQYRNWLAIADAATRAGAENGIISPTQLQSAVVRTQGRRNVAIGNTTELGELSRAGAAILRPMPTVEAGAIRRPPLQYGTSAFGAVAGQQWASDPMTGALIGGMAGAAIPSVSQGIIRSNALQNLMMDPSGQLVNALRTVPGLTAGQ